MSREKGEKTKRDLFPAPVPYLIQIYASGRVVFEACRHISEYSEEKIVIDERGERVSIEGKHLKLKDLSNGNLSAQGEISAIRFEKRRGRG